MPMTRRIHKRDKLMAPGTETSHGGAGIRKAGAHAIDPLLFRLGNFMELAEADQLQFRESIVREVRVGKGKDVICENERPDYVHIVIDGWACRYKYLADGRRAILGYLIPGDVCDVHIALLDHMDHAVSTLTPASFALISRETVNHIFENNISLAYALFWASLVEESVQREWFVNNTGRPADKRLAHLLCELQMRHRAAGLTRTNCIDFPLVQQDLADAMGITVVHTNRVMQKLRSDGLISYDNKLLTILDWEGLKAFGDFDPRYMHLSEETLNL
ncbi:Crp/Fnr family transcriptional regulator [Modicisalibacter xianhensis]|uniref:cAMP-binding domain of CRP or a regulatory subunit of cAMP-dependent protein kinases n=1 Tax=Modicisalibacter xianhensis TaxID=442341 RepID=A0A1I3EZG7_9GAMM|nr:Crp/Fnr family transcriptional regulator [Halomonas xianhensis]SFI04260.1 cAMP-binding domain of CRP or a regulatory subunit of cAMP-dependent protein kinases [Halomonas xianhensis]